MSRLAAFLRRLADQLDPQAPVPPKPSHDDENAQVETGRRERVREIQAERVRELQVLLGLIRDHDADGGLLWLESWQLRAVVRLIEHELAQRDRDFAAIEARWK